MAIISMVYFITLFQLLDVNDALRYTYKMKMSKKLSLNLINHYKIETYGGV